MRLSSAIVGGALAATLFATSFQADGQGSGPGEGERFLLLDFRRPDSTPEGSAKALVDRMRQFVVWAIPRTPGVKPMECKVEFTQAKGAAPFASCTRSSREASVLIGASFARFRSDPELLRKLMETLLLARCGVMVEKSEGGLPNWLVDGLTRRAMTSELAFMVPGGASYPGATALAGADVYPSLRSVVESKLLPSDGAVYELNAEYCQILLMASAGAGMASNGGFMKLVLDSLRPARPGAMASFVEAFNIGRVPPSKEKDSSRTGGGGLRGPADEEALSNWFERSARGVLHCCFSPLPATLVEQRMKSLGKVSFEDREGKLQACELAGLPAKWDSVKDGRLLVADLRARLAVLASVSPIEMQEPVWRIQEALNGLLAVQGKADGAPLASALGGFYDALEARIACEAALKRFERAFVPVAFRFNSTLAAVGGFERREEAVYPKETAFLEAYIAREAAR